MVYDHLGATPSSHGVALQNQGCREFAGSLTQEALAQALAGKVIQRMKCT